MRFPRTDKIATSLVAAALVGYAGWLALAERPDDTSVRVMVGVVLALGFAASATAVVPGFEELLRSSRAYLVVASLIGFGAFVAGVVALIGANEAMLAVLVAATVVLWAMATARHVRLAAARHDERAAAHRSREHVAAGRPR